MKIVIEHSETKREISGPFNLCGSRKDLLRLANQIRKQVKRKKRFSSGWVWLSAGPMIINTPPIPWDD